MFGSLPTMPFQPPTLPPGYAGQPLTYQPTPFQPMQTMPAMPGNWAAAPQPNPQPPAMPVLANMATGNANTRNGPRPKIRLQAPDMPKTALAARLVLPSPEDLGVGVPRPTPSQVQAPANAPAQMDWNVAHARLNRLGALAFHLERLTQGGCRVTFLLPSSQAQQTHHVEVVADTEAVAVTTALDQAEQRNSALDQAEQWAGR